MTILIRTSVKTYFVTGARPTQSQFGDFIDSALFLAETTSQTIVGSIIVSGNTTLNGGLTVLGGTVSITSAALSSPVITSGAINSTVIGATSAAAANFTSAVLVSGLAFSNAPTTAAILQVNTSGGSVIENNAFAGAATFLGQRTQGRADAKAKVSANNQLASFGGGGYDGTNYSGYKGGVRIIAATDWATTDNGTLVLIQTTSAGSTTVEECTRFDSKKNVFLSFDGTTGVIATGATDRMPSMPSCAGAKTGTPTTQTGMCPFVYDTTNNKLWIYNTPSAAWKSVALT